MSPRIVILVIITLIFITKTKVSPSQSNTKIFAIAIHGGAGTIRKENMTPEMEKEYKDKLNEAMLVGYKILENNGSSLDAVESAIKVLEDSPLFNAGKGSVFTSDGKNEMDASIMDGKTLKAGAVAAINTIKNPISAARAVMEKSPHVLLTGPGAIQFAKDQGLEIVDSSYFYTDFRFNQWQKAKEQNIQQLDHSGDKKPKGYNSDSENAEKYGTVGAVALDQSGNLAAATSTGGMTNKKWGRIGDSPIIGAGTYANNKTCAVSATGHGEFFMRALVAYDISALMDYKKLSLEEATHEVVMKKLVELGGEGGVIAIDSKGYISLVFNSEGMYRGYRKSDGTGGVMIYK